MRELRRTVPIWRGGADNRGMKRVMSTLAAIGTGVVLLSACGGTSYDADAVDPMFRDTIQHATGCEDVQSIANAMNARVKAFAHNTDTYKTAYATFMAAGDKLTELHCPGW